MNKRFSFDYEEENKVQWMQQTLEFLYDIGYQNIKNKPKTDNKQHSDIVTIKYNYKHYKQFTMPYRDDDGKFIINERSMPKLHEIYYIASSYCDNVYIPLNKRYRGKFVDSKTMIPNIDYICLECDNATFKEQLTLLNIFKPYIKTAIYSGSKSIHIWLKTDIPTFNSPSKEIANNPEDWQKLYEYIEDKVIESIGVQEDNSPKYDKKVLHDYATWIRLPFCTRKNNSNTRIIYHDSIPDSLSITDIFSYEEDFNDLEENDSVEKHDSSSQSYTDITNDVTFDNLEHDLEQEYKHSHLKTIPNFFDNITRYLKYINSGLPSKGLRISMYADVIIANRILTGFDYHKLPKKAEQKHDISSLSYTVITNDVTFVDFRSKCLEDVTKIIELSEGRYNCTFEYAINDFNNYFSKTKLLKLPIRMPNVTSINSTYELKSVQEALNRLEVLENKNIAKLLINLFIGNVKNLPAQCMNGTLGLHMNNDIRSNINMKRTKQVMESLKNNNILIKTQDYVLQSKTNKYWLNVPFVLWLTTKPESLNWSKK